VPPLAGALALLAAAMLLAAGAAAQAPPSVEPTGFETPEVLPPGEGREEAFHRCVACHSTAVIRRTALSRERWDELMDWMTEKHAMPPLDDAERAQIVGYLAKAFPPRRGGPRGRSNPFAEGR